MKKKILNLTPKENAGLNSLLRRVKENQIRITATDKSSRLSVMTYDQYIEAGKQHTSKDIEIKWKTVKYLQNQVNNHVWWLGNILGYCQESNSDRMMKNLLDHGYEVPQMSILVKDHKDWSFSSKKPLPSRPIMSGNSCLN